MINCKYYELIIKKSTCLLLTALLLAGAGSVRVLAAETSENSAPQETEAFTESPEEEESDEAPQLQVYAETILRDEFQARTRQFLSDDRWKNGAEWPNGQRPLISKWSSIGCCAYAMDFAKFVYGIDGVRTAGEEYKDVDEIRVGDIIHVSPEHWFVVLERNGSRLKTAEGAWASQVQVGYSYYRIEDGTLLNTALKDPRVNKIVEAFHFPIAETTYQEIRESAGESSERCVETVLSGISQTP